LLHIGFKAEAVSGFAAIQLEWDDQVQRLADPSIARRPPDGHGRRLKRSADEKETSGDSKSLQGTDGNKR